MRGARLASTRNVLGRPPGETRNPSQNPRRFTKLYIPPPPWYFAYPCTRPSLARYVVHMTHASPLRDLALVPGDVVQFPGGSRYRLTRRYERSPLYAWEARKVSYGRGGPGMGASINDVVPLKRNALVRVVADDAPDEYELASQIMLPTTTKESPLFTITTVRTQAGWVGQVHAALPAANETVIVWESEPIDAPESESDASASDTARRLASEQLATAVTNLFA